MGKFEVFVGAVFFSLVFALFFGGSGQKSTEESPVPKVPLSRDSELLSIAPLSELLSRDAEIGEAVKDKRLEPRMPPPRDSEETRAVQRRTAESSDGAQSSSWFSRVSSALRGEDADDTKKDKVAEVVDPIEGSKFSEGGGDILSKPPIIAGHGKAAKVSYTGIDMDKEMCRGKYGQLRYYKQSEKKLPPMLYTFPGSGNTWGRLLIEYATGIYSGSVYSDPTLRSTLPGEFICDHSVSVIKVHPHTHNAQELLNGGFNSDHMKCNKGKVGKFQKAVLLIRDPFDSIWSEYQRRLTQSHVSGIPTSYFDWFRWQANAANMAYRYWEMWKLHYTAIETQLPRENVLYIKYEDLKNKEKRVNALYDVANFLGIDASAEQLNCAFILAENPGAHRKLDEDSMTKQVAYTKPVACRMWNLYGNFANRVGYKIWNNLEGCNEYPKMNMINVGPQGEYNHRWVKGGKKLIDFGDHPPNGPNAGRSLVRGPGYGKPSGGGTLSGAGTGSMDGGGGLFGGRGEGKKKMKKGFGGAGKGPGGPGQGKGKGKGFSMKRKNKMKMKSAPGAGMIPDGVEANLLVPRGEGRGGGGMDDEGGISRGEGRGARVGAARYVKRNGNGGMDIEAASNIKGNGV